MCASRYLGNYFRFWKNFGRIKSHSYTLTFNNLFGTAVVHLLLCAVRGKDFIKDIRLPLKDTNTYRYKQTDVCIYLQMCQFNIKSHQKSVIG